MSVNRRGFIKSVAGVGAAAMTPGCKIRVEKSDEILERLKRAASAPVLELEGLDSPLIIDSLQLLQKNGEYFVHVRSRDGAEGVALTNSRAAYLYPILNRLVMPYFIGKDARDLEDHLFGVYRYQSNYKLQGIALWCPVAWVEFAILDMLGRIVDKSLGDLLGGVIRTADGFYPSCCADRQQRRCGHQRRRPAGRHRTDPAFSPGVYAGG